jgi:hypothetical protein
MIVAVSVAAGISLLRLAPRQSRTTMVDASEERADADVACLALARV